MKIKNIDFGNNLFIAPMAGVSDIGFREQCCIFGADASVSEMLSARAMMHNPKKTKLMTITSPLEKIKIGQIFGHESDVMAKAVENPLLAHYDVIDINMGCPAPKILKNGEGASLMDKPSLAGEIVSACVNATDRPVSVKFRLGYHSKNFVDFGRMCEESGASFVTLHARTVEQGYSGKADYEAIAKLKSVLSIPLIGNGDVVDRQSYQQMLKTGVDGVMVGRGAQGKPWIFAQLLGKDTSSVNKFEVIKAHVETLRKYYDEDWLTLYMRKHFLWYTLGEVGGSAIRLELATSPSIDQSLAVLKKFFEE